MSHDYSRINHNPADDYLGVLLQQGRPLADADWNALVAEVTRRVQAGTFDTLGPAVVPQTTPDAFLITPSGGSFTIGRGRIYVDGLLAENHGTGTLQWDAHLAEAFGRDPIPYASQPYLPNPPALPEAGPYLVYVDVWQREVGPLQDEQLLEKALGGVDTTVRLQTVWQVRALAVGGSVDCGTPLDEIDGWASRTAPSAGRLTTATGDVDDDPNPCLVPPTDGYKGGENQLYRVEVHKGGLPGTATFKWSRDNASVQARVLRIPNATHLVVDSVGKDEVLRFNDGDWIEVLDDVNELSGDPGDPGDPGVLRRIVTGGGVDDASRTLTLEQALPPGRFPVDAQGVPTGDRHMRLRRWDQSGLVRRADGTPYADLDAAGSTGEIIIPTDATQLLLESGILVSFGVANAGGRFRNGDWWAFTARAVDASLEILEAAPPRGIHHHYAKLAVVTPPDAEDCRVHWPPGGCCTVVVHPGESIQAAIDSLPVSGGCVCLKTGLHIITQPIVIISSRVILHGESPGVIVRGSALPYMLAVGGVQDVEVMMIDFELESALEEATIVLLESCTRVRVHQCAMRYTGNALGYLVGIRVFTSTQVQLTSNAVERCYIGIQAEGRVRELLIEHNRLRGLLYELSGGSFIIARWGVRLTANIAVQCRANDIEDFLTGVLILPGTGEAVVADNDIRRRPVPAEFDSPLLPEAMVFAIEANADRSRIEGNRIDLASQGFGGILVTGRHNDVLGNRITSNSATSSFTGPIGVFVGAFLIAQTGNGDATNVALNHFTGIQLAVRVSRARGVRVAGNMIQGSGRTAGQGIIVSNGIEVLVAENQLRDLALPLALSNGRQNRVTSNVMSATAAGARIAGEDGIEFRGNLIEDASLFGVSVEEIETSARLAHNRIAHCAYAAAASYAGAVVILDSNGNADVTVESCDIVNTGVSPDRAKTTPLTALGIFAIYVPRIQIANNRILYEGANALNPNLEHRALLLVGGPIYARTPSTVSQGGALITGNVLQGPGRTHLVQLFHSQVETLSISFDKVTFANNRCDHLTTIEGARTVALYGTHMIVMGNHVTALSRIVFSMDLGSRPRVALLGNYTTGLYASVNTTVPTPHTNYNVRI